jgi:heat shock protein HtpX
MNAELARTHAASNRWQTVWLVFALCGTAGLAGYVLLGDNGLWIALGAVLLALVVEPFAARRMTLALYRARPLHPAEAPRLWSIVSLLARRAGLPTVPVPHLVPSATANAFAVGNRKDSAIAVSASLLAGLSEREIAAVLAHEVGHIANGDLRVMSLADYVSRLTAVCSLLGVLVAVILMPSWLVEGAPLPWMGLLILGLAPYAAILAQSGLSRIREFDADLAAAELTGDPEALASALARIEGGYRTWRGWVLPGWRNPQPSWLRTHPPTRERIRRLMALAYPSGPVAIRRAA